MRMTEHVRKVSEKASKVCNVLSCLMPRKGGPSNARRNLLATVIRSVTLYGAPVWESALRFKKYAKILRLIERRTAISATSAYRTVATEAVSALAGHPPMDLLAWERSRNWETRGENAEINKESMFEKWQQRWNEYGGWAKTFIKSVRDWKEKGPRVDYYTTQAIMGHGEYLKKIKKIESDICWFGCRESDTPRHTIFKCARFERERATMNVELEHSVTEENVADLIMKDEKHQNIIIRYFREVMKAKDAEGRTKRRVHDKEQHTPMKCPDGRIPGREGEGF
nr:uncharacterized protein LOC111418057 [Onthophagus taurus]